MALTLVSAPAVEPVSVAEMKARLRFESSDEDVTVTQLVAAARLALDGRDGVLGRALITQTWRLTLDGFPSSIVLPLPPCQSVTSIAYVDEAGATQTLAPSAYQLVGAGDSDAASIVPAYGTSWPATRTQPEAVTVTFVAGYGAAADVPEPIRTAIAMHAAHLFENREAVGYLTPSVQPLGWAELIAPYRVWEFGA